MSIEWNKRDERWRWVRIDDNEMNNEKLEYRIMNIDMNNVCI